MPPLFEFLPAGWKPVGQSVLVLLIALLVGLLLHAVCYLVADRVTRKTQGVADSAMVTRTRRTARFTLLFLALHLAAPSLPLSESTLVPIRHVIVLLLIGAMTWFAIRSLSVVDDVILVRYPIDVRDNLRARMIHTQTRLLTRILMVVVAIIGISAMLMTFPRIRQLGASVLASAGIAGLIVGFAARPTLGNLIAGVQLALTQPIRIDDVVIVEGEWGWIEQIKSTYVVVRIWDQRRLIVPLQYFIEHPFQNWTRQSADILGTVFLHVDYTLPVEAVRTELRRIVESTDLWDGRVCVLQVTDAKERTLELRALVSAADSPKAWELRCLVREKLVEFLQRRYPGSLPRTRAELAGEITAIEGTREVKST